MPRTACHRIILFVGLLTLVCGSWGEAVAQLRLSGLCVRYARALTDFDIYGDAWTWWHQAVGRYGRGSRPRDGAVLVFRKTSTMPYGHVAVVSGIVDRRTILVDHSWIAGRGLHRGMKIIDTSLRNDWSEVRVWYEPGSQMGQSRYPAFGFIYPEPDGNDLPAAVIASAEGAENSDRNPAEPTAVTPSRRGSRTLAAARTFAALRFDQQFAFSRSVAPVQGLTAGARTAASGPALRRLLPEGVAAPLGQTLIPGIASLPSHRRGLASFDVVAPSVVATLPRHKPGSQPAVVAAAGVPGRPAAGSSSIPAHRRLGVFPMALAAAKPKPIDPERSGRRAELTLAAMPVPAPRPGTVGSVSALAWVAPRIQARAIQATAPVIPPAKPRMTQAQRQAGITLVAEATVDAGAGRR